MSTCLYCNSLKSKPCKFQEPALFNNTIWDYAKCTDCGLIMLQPLPSSADLDVMYGAAYHAEYYFQNEPYSITRYQSLFSLPSNKSVLDFGCGDASFLNAIPNKLIRKCGVEYDPELVKKLKNTFPQIEFFTKEEWGQRNELFDIIHLGDVLEHSVHPQQLIKELKKHLNNNGFLIVEGPLEANPNLAYVVRRLAQLIKQILGKQKPHKYVPYHTLFANYENQLQFFETMGLKKVRYEVFESSWPYPAQLQRSFFNNIKFFVAKISILISSLFPTMGNRFIYVGRK